MTTSQPNDYFLEAYRDYQAQNPERKLDHYLDTIVAGAGPGPFNVLDVGCGLGAFLARAATRFPSWSLSGIDIDETAIDRASHLVTRGDLRVGSADQRAFPPATFDVITAWDSLEHVADLDAARDAIRSMIRPDGYFYMVVPVYDGITGPLIRLLDRDPTHIHKRGREFWLDWVSTDFELVDWHGIYRYLLPGGHYIHWPTHSLRHHTSAVLIECRPL